MHKPINELIVLEYSYSQNAFHNCTVEDCINKNITIISRNQQSDYVLIGIFEDKDAALKAMKIIWPAIDKYRNQNTVEVGSLTIKDLIG